MFTGASFSLSAFAQIGCFSVVRDGQFRYVGKVPTRLAAKLVPLGQKIHLKEALGHEDIAAVITTPALANDVPTAWALAIADRPMDAVYRVHGHLCGETGALWADFASDIDPSAEIDPAAHVAPRNVRIGAGSRVLAGAVVHERSIIGSNCVIGNNSVIGSPGFEVSAYAGEQRTLPQAGGVMIGDNVEILVGAVVARATFGGFTSIGDGSKIDNMVHVAHDCCIGRNVQIVSCAALGGRVTIGDGAFVGSNAVTSPGLTISAGARVSMGAVVVRDVPEGETVSGHFAVQHMKWLRFISSALR